MTSLPVFQFSIFKFFQQAGHGNPVHNLPMQASPLTHYTLGESEEELRRLVALASHEEDRVIDACRRAGVREGAVALDAGCGPLGALAALAGVVGRSGTVVGIDANAGALGKARALLPPDSYPSLRFVHRDVNELTIEDLGSDRVDVVYSRLMLLHQRDPARTVARLASLMTAGAVFIAHEPSDLPHHAPASEPHVPAMTRVWELVIGAANARGARTDFGRTGRAGLEAAGLVVESHCAYAVHYPAEIGYEIPRVALASLRPVLAAQKLAYEDEVDALDRALDEAKHRPGVQWVSGPLMFEWIARKPRP